MDDIKESVRLAAAKTVAALSRACIKMCDVAQYPKSGEAAVRSILVLTFYWCSFADFSFVSID
jgi:hypothetical protein